MHRHGYKGKKLGRERDQRRALIRGLSTSLVEYESIETTLPKAKAFVPQFEKLVTKAKKGDLASKRAVFASLDTKEAAHKLIDDIAPKLSGRTSGHVRVVRTGLRRGDNAQLARVSFVDNLDAKSEKPAKKKAAKPESTKKSPTTKKATTKTKTAVKAEQKQEDKK